MDVNEILLGAGSIEEMKDRVYGYMLSTRRKKFRHWILGIKILKKLACWAEKCPVPLGTSGISYFKDAGARVEMLEDIYIALRLADDIADGDAKLEAESSVMYIIQLIAFVIAGGMPNNLPKKLLAHALRLGGKFGLDMHKPILDVLRSLRFDAERRESHTIVICDEAELAQNYDLCDIKGVVIGCLVAARERPYEWKRVAPLARAVRIRFNIRDLDDEMDKNICNISKQDVEIFQIADVRDTHSPEMRRWILKEARRAIALLDTYRDRMLYSSLHPITRAILYWAFERPTRKSLERILKTTA